MMLLDMGWFLVLGCLVEEFWVLLSLPAGYRLVTPPERIFDRNGREKGDGIRKKGEERIEKGQDEQDEQDWNAEEEEEEEEVEVGGRGRIKGRAGT